MLTIVHIKSVLLNKHLHLIFFKPLFNLTVVTIMGFTIAGIGAVKLAQTLEPPDNLFTRYLALFPGQLMNTVTERGFSCNFVGNYYTTPKETHCVFVPPESVFSEIVVIGTNEYVREIKFIFHKSTFRLGDLLTMFGIPKFHSYAQVTFAFWSDFFVELRTDPTHGINPTYAYIWTVTFTLADR